MSHYYPHTLILVASLRSSAPSLFDPFFPLTSLPSFIPIPLTFFVLSYLHYSLTYSLTYLLAPLLHPHHFLHTDTQWAGYGLRFLIQWRTDVVSDYLEFKGPKIILQVSYLPLHSTAWHIVLYMALGWVGLGWVELYCNAN